MNTETLLKIFENHPLLGAVLLLASMFFISVWWRGWPEKFLSFSAGVDDEDDEEEDDEDEEKKYTVTWQQTEIINGTQGLPESVKGVFTIKKNVAKKYLFVG